MRPGAEVLQRGATRGFVHPPTVPRARDTLGPDKTVGPALALHPGGERAAQEGMDSLCATMVAVKAEGETIRFLGDPQAPHTRARGKRDDLALHPPQRAQPWPTCVQERRMT